VHQDTQAAQELAQISKQTVVIADHVQVIALPTLSVTELNAIATVDLMHVIISV